MTRTLPVSEAKTQLSKLVKGVQERDAEIVITRKGRPAAILLSMDHYEGLQETLELLSDPKAMAEIRKNTAPISSGAGRAILSQKVHASLRLLRVDPMAGKPLERELTGCWSYPIHPYRIIYQVESSKRQAHPVMVEPRREIYDLLQQQFPLVRDRVRRKSRARRRAGTDSLLR